MGGGIDEKRPKHFGALQYLAELGLGETGPGWKMKLLPRKCEGLSSKTKTSRSKVDEVLPIRSSR
jgi:hypothetical protein